MTQQELRQISLETLNVIASPKYVVNGKTYNMRDMVMNMVDNTRLYKATDFIPVVHGIPWDSSYHLVNMTTTGSILHFQQFLNQKIGVLNFASAIKAGGGWLNGKVAQEEDIMRKTTAFLSLLLQDEFYTSHNIADPIYSDAIIYSPKVLIIRDENYNFIEPEAIDLFTCAAVNATECRNNMIKCDFKKRMYDRIDKVIRAMAVNNEETIVLGAFGCGVFGNNPTNIADIFHEILVEEQMENKFKNIIFAVYDNSPTLQNFNAFQNVFYDRL